MVTPVIQPLPQEITKDLHKQLEDGFIYPVDAFPWVSNLVNTVVSNCALTTRPHSLDVYLRVGTQAPPHVPLVRPIPAV
jgi:hypothetical protein